MEHKIGEIFEYKGEWYQCIEGYNCKDCDLRNIICHRDTEIFPFSRCAGAYREDKKSVIFKKLEKVGGTYAHNNVIVQKYRIVNIPVIMPNEPYMYFNAIDNTIAIEIKQNKKDMEEKKQCGDNRFRAIARAKEHLFQTTNIAENKKELEVLDSFLLRCWQMGWLKQYEDAEEKKLNLKLFNIQKAREGKPVCTRDGHKVRIICFDKADERPIVALISDNGSEFVYEYLINGKCYESRDDSNDLMMLPEKKEGWVNVYKERIYDTKEEAIEATYDGVTYVDTVKVCWEE